MLSSITSLLIEGRRNCFFICSPLLINITAEKGSGQVITTTLIAFKQNDGIKAVTEILETFWNEVQDLPSLSEAEQMGRDGHQRMAHAYGGIKIILSLFTHLVSNKSVLESSQTQALQTRDRPPEPNRPDLWNASQFLVELRASILPVVRSMWDSGSIEKASGSIVKSAIEILGIVLKAENEAGAFTKKDLEKKAKLSNTISWRTMEPNEDRIRQLLDMGFARDNAMSALLRCNGNVISATELLTSQGNQTPQRGSQISTSSSRPHTAESQSSDDEEGTDVDVAREETAPEAPPVAPEDRPSSESAMPPPPPPVPADDGIPGQDSVMAMSIDDLVAPDVVPPPPTIEPEATTPVATETSSATVDKGKGKEGETPEMTTVTVEDLDAIRSTIRENLINRSLDVLQVHPNVTFELSALITNGFGKVTESAEIRKEVASTIFQSLMSLQMDDDLRPQGKTIASTAHLLGLVLQNQDFFDSCLDDLKDNIPTLVGFIKIYPGEPAPWIANILLVVEKVLSESAQPRRIHFSPPGEAETENNAESNPCTISDKDQSSLFEAIIAIVPEISKDEVLPLAVVRVLVLLTRRRELAICMTEKGYLQQLFHMFRRQSGLSTERIQSSLMVILRHIIEDVDILKSIMKAEIRSWFNSRGSRQSDTQSFIRHNHHLVLRNPEVFVEVVNELCKLTRYDPHLRNQHISIKDSWRLNPPPPVAEPAKPAEEESKETGSKETEDKEMVDKPKPAAEIKPPGLEKPDGVIHFLLSELLACKDVEDSVPVAPTHAKEEATAPQIDVQMDNAESVSVLTEDPQANLPSEPKKPEKPEFKAEQHPTFIYRCFILQALTELLSCYNRSKIEFINFSRKAAPREPITPSKPRSAILNYLLNDIIPLGTLLHTEDIAYKKRATTSQWAILAIVSLSAQTGEITNTEDEPNLLFVRKFILESALKAFKDASFSTEPLDTKYSRMMSLTDLFFRMLSARPNHNHSPGASASEKPPQQIARIMFEKNFIAALTSSLADIDLNFPSARRVIKYILRPLKLLSKTATELSETSSISSLGPTDEDEISTASSVSDIDDMREETPDLYRNSTLGMFEGGEMVDDDQSSYDEDEEDDEMYDEEMELEEGMEDEGESEVSEEDEDHQEDMDVSAHGNRDIAQMIDIVQVEIVVQEEHHDDSEDEDDDDELSDDMDEEGEGVEIIDEMAEDHQGHYGSGGEDDWQSEGSEDDDGEDEEIITDNPLETIVRALGGAEEVPEPGDEDREDGFIDDEVEEEDEDEDDEDMDEEEAMIQEDYEDDEGAFSAVPWGWAEEAGEAPMMARAHPRGHGGWYTLGGPPRDPPVFSKPIFHALGSLRKFTLM